MVWVPLIDAQCTVQQRFFKVSQVRGRVGKSKPGV